MGAMECGVGVCRNPLCNQYFDEFGYICDEHLESLIRYLEINGTSNDNIRRFFNGDKVCSSARDYVMDMLHFIDWK